MGAFESARGGVTYDPNERRETALARKLRKEIAATGPLTVATFMHRCFYDPEHGYYSTHSPVGAAGDFTTAPEISQIFGELIGLWMAVVWDRMGRPDPVSVVEFGPGRGTMMADALRAARAVPDFVAAARVVLAETSAVMEAIQRQTLREAPSPVRWIRDDLFDFPAPAIIVGNEFLDVWSIEQFVKTEAGWRERRVGLDAAGKLAFMPFGDDAGSTSFTFTEDGTAMGRTLDAAFPDVEPGDVFEWPDLSHIVGGLAAVANRGPLAASFFDYGYMKRGLGDTLQAVRNHHYEHPLTSPGEADLTAHVDFGNFAWECQGVGLAVDGPVTQAEFLGSLGIMERASRLMAANPSKAGEIEAGVARLMAPNGMGTRFKAMGVRSPSLPPLPGF